MKKYSDNFISNYITANARKNPDGYVAVCGDKRLTWKQLHDRTNSLAQALISMGVKKDDKVLFMLHNRLEFIETNYAIQKCGAIPVPMNYRFTPPEIEFQADNSDSVVFITEDIWLKTIQEARPNLKKIKCYVCAGDCPSDMIPYEKLISEHESKDPNVPTSSDDVCVICYTGGTTGFPKGVMLTYGAHIDMLIGVAIAGLKHLTELSFSSDIKNRLSQTSNIQGASLILSIMKSPLTKKIIKSKINLYIMKKFISYMLKNPVRFKKIIEKKSSIIFPSFPLFHDASYQLLMHAPVLGNMVLLMPEGVTFDAKKVMEMIAKEKPNAMCNVPTGWKMLMDYPDITRFDASTLFILISGGGLFHAEDKKRLLTMFPGRMLVDMLGQTEMTPVVSFKIDVSPDTVDESNVGKPMVTTRIIDENGNDVPQGKIGEILYKSSTVMKGYYKDSEKTSETIKDGWLYSGDLGYFDKNGSLKVIERKKECITTGGEKVFPIEVEHHISTHPDVEHVCIIGVPDEKWGSTIRAVVQTRSGAKLASRDITSLCEGKLARYKIPKSVIFIDEFPLSPVGKMLRGKVRELYGKP